MTKYKIHSNDFKFSNKPGTFFQIKKRFAFFWVSVKILYKSEFEDIPPIWIDTFSTLEEAEYYLNLLESK